jgi:hypothetical protein
LIKLLKKSLTLFVLINKNNMKIIQGKKYRCLCEVKAYGIKSIGEVVEVIYVYMVDDRGMVALKTGSPLPLDIFMACFEPCEE